jgi:DNA polymerase III subunit gamma/tau
MSYQVIARKWRPQSFDEMVGQHAVVQTLKNAILQNRIAHAYLFAGARGVGKTTMARILAKALNCLQGPTVDPCNNCPSCREIAGGSSIDVLEIDAASNRGIDEIRELRENVKYAAARDRYKVFIIDEVHMLTVEAFNALLKTLEEPPPHVVFVLATTELHKVPSTILSRCQHFNFRAISPKEILDQLSYIAIQEQIRIDERALHAIARASEGSMRDAQSLLDQVISFCGNEIADEQVRDLLGIIPQQILEEFTVAIIDGNAKQILLLVERLVQSGRNLQSFVREMLSHLRNLLMVRIAGEDSQLVPLDSSDLTRLKEFASHFSEEDLTRFFSILVATDGELRWSSQPRFHLEMGLMKIVQAKRLVPIEELLTGLKGILQREEGMEATPKSASELAPPASNRFTLSSKARTQLEPRAALGSDVDQKGLAEELKSGISQRSPMVSSLLEHALSLKLVEGEIEIQFSNQNKFYYEMLQSEENVGLIKELADSVFGKPQQIKVVLVNGQAQQSSLPGEKSAENISKQPLLDRVKGDSTIKTFLDTFQGEITDVKELK